MLKIVVDRVVFQMVPPIYFVGCYLILLYVYTGLDPRYIFGALADAPRAIPALGSSKLEHA